MFNPPSHLAATLEPGHPVHTFLPLIRPLRLLRACKDGRVNPSATFDVAVVGLGPAGRSLASRCLARGLSVLVVDVTPDAAWTPTYGVWADELVGVPDDVVGVRIPRPELRSVNYHVLERDYVVLDNAALQRAFPIESAEIRRARLDDAGVVALREEARVVVDARGARPEGRIPHDPAPAQTAYGIVLTAEDAAPALQGANALLMDWRTDWSPDPEPSDVPTFLYVFSLGDGRMLLEETCLAASPGVPIEELKQRLRTRLLARGVRASAIDEPLEREVVWIPMLGRGAPPLGGVLAVGTAGRGGHLVTGYSVAHSLATADALAKDIAAGRVPKRADRFGASEFLRRAGLRALLRLDLPGTLALFEGFGRLSPSHQKAFMSRDSGAGALARAMWGMFVRMPARDKLRLVAATLGPAPRDGQRRKASHKG